MKDLAKQIEDGLNIQTDMGREVIKVALECIELFDRKQQDYGSSNIGISGEIGIQVRLQDKVSRMRHLLNKRMQDPEMKINNESLDDTYQDVANYGLIGMLLSRGKWE
mgnify:CR=1 FL=1|tara:strand:+ start:70 stop:393 length:324 start_codon:yes stop_codon:yes gene_type:complete